MKEPARIFVADHQGMVGAAILRQLLVQQHPLDHLVTRTPRELPLHDQAAVEAFFASERIDQIYLPVPLPSSTATQHPAIPLLALTQVIHAASVHRVPKLVLIGTPHVYPITALSPMVEECLLNGYLAPATENFALAQIAAIKLCGSLSRPRSSTQARFPALDYRCLIIPTPYGPGDHLDTPGDHTVASVIQQVHQAKLANQPRLPLPSLHDTWHEYLYVDDGARAAIYLMNASPCSYRQQVPDGIAHLNAGDRKYCSLGALAHAAAGVIGYTGVIEAPPTDPDWMPRRRLDSYRMHNLGWRPSLNMEDALALTYFHYLAHQGELLGGTAS